MEPLRGNIRWANMYVRGIVWLVQIADVTDDCRAADARRTSAPV